MSAALRREAHNWLLAESALADNRMARHAAAALISGEECHDLALAWLRRVAATTTRRALWAGCVLREIEEMGQ